MMPRKLKYIYALLLVTISLLALPAVKAYSQDTVSTADVQFVPAAPDKANLAVKDAGTSGQNIVKQSVIRSEIKAAAKAEEKKSLWAIFIAGLIGGFAAVLMPCIFPMLPMTVSYFIKSGEKGGSGIGK